tara:strand:+ start:111 stop:245 length:135 start_codon:yes stop_codon:yes gene_type:complete
MMVEHLLIQEILDMLMVVVVVPVVRVKALQLQMLVVPEEVEKQV